MSDIKLFFDIGNSRIKWAYSRAEHFTPGGVFLISELTPALLHDNFAHLKRPESVWVSNVGARPVVKRLNDWFNAEYSIDIQIIEATQTCSGITNNYQTQDTLGVDRWVAAIGARSVIESGHVIVIDAGTAVTIDWLSESNGFEGGTILPGFNLMHDSLTGKTAGIKSESSWAERILGRTTKECVNSGVSFGLLGAIERVIWQMTEYIAEPVSLILTGGSAAAIASRSELDFIVEENLVLLGVARIASERS